MTSRARGHAVPGAARKLRAIKLLHTVVWAFFAACIVSIPVAVHAGHLVAALVLVAVVFADGASRMLHSALKGRIS